MLRFRKDIIGKSKLNITPVEYANRLIYLSLMDDKPFMFARFGTVELGTVTNYLGIKNQKRNYCQLIKGSIQPWWWMRGVRKTMYENAGFFTPSSTNLYRFAELMLEDMNEIDILASLSAEEEYFRHIFPNAKRVSFNSAEPFFSVYPWTHALEGKTVLVVHPMTESITRQWEIREKIWPDGMMPDFTLKTIRAVQTIAGEKSEFKSWFDALDHMKEKISKIEFDVCIIGCGAYGFPLAAHVKRMGKKALHFGGVTQLFFGIRGKRWEVDPHFPFTNFMNEYWVRPDTSETPQNANIVEGGCYW